MDAYRRRLIAGAAALAVWPGALGANQPPRAQNRYGRIGKILTLPGERDALAAVLLEGTRDMPGCLSYVIALDADNDDALWVTEVWVDEASHAASLGLPGVQAAMAKGGPLIAGFELSVVTTPIGGHGLSD